MHSIFLLPVVPHHHRHHPHLYHHHYNDCRGCIFIYIKQDAAWQRHISQGIMAEHDNRSGGSQSRHSSQIGRMLLYSGGGICQVMEAGASKLDNGGTLNQHEDPGCSGPLPYEDYTHNQSRNPDATRARNYRVKKKEKKNATEQQLRKYNAEIESLQTEKKRLNQSILSLEQQEHNQRMFNPNASQYNVQHEQGSQQQCFNVATEQRICGPFISQHYSHQEQHHQQGYQMPYEKGSSHHHTHYPGSF